MGYDQYKTPIEAWGPDVKVARVRWAPSSAAAQVLTEAQGVTGVSRSGIGAYTIQLQDTNVKDLECIVGYIENEATIRHHVRVESQDIAAGTIAVSHKVATFGAESVVTVKGRLPDVSAPDADVSNRAYATAPQAGTITKIQAQIVSGGPLNAAAIVTNKINGTNITTGAITLPDTSAVGTTVAVTPTAANIVAVGDTLTGVTDGGGSTAAAVDVTYTIQGTGTVPAGSDTVDQMYAVIFYRIMN